MTGMSNKPLPEHLAELHRRLLARDPVAPAELAESTIEPLAKELRIGTGRVRDEQLSIDAATDAALELARRAEKYDPTKMAVWSFLCMAARRNLANALLKERRHAARVFFRSAAVALPPSVRNRASVRPLDQLADAELARTRLAELASGPMSTLPPEDLAVLRLMAAGERETARFAAVIGCADRPRKEQQRLVKQVKDRLLKQLRRSASEGSDE
jgi:hypothetical protein